MRAHRYKEQFQGCGYAKKLAKEQFKQAVLDGHIPYAVADSECTTTYVKPIEQQIKVSECRITNGKVSHLLKTGNKSNKCFL